MKNKYCLSVVLLNTCFMFCAPLAGSSINGIEEETATSFLDSNWRNSTIEKEIESIEQDIASIEQQCDRLQKELDDLEKRLNREHAHAKNLALHGTFEEITTARQNCRVIERLVDEKKSEIVTTKQRLVAAQKGRVAKVAHYHSIILAAAEKNITVYRAFIQQSKKDLFEKNKELWALLDYKMVQSICRNLTPNYHARTRDEKVYYHGSRNGIEVTYASLFNGWNAHCSYYDKNAGKRYKRSSMNDHAFATTQLSLDIAVDAKKLDELWRNTDVEPQWTNLNTAQKISSSSIKSYTYQLYKAELDLIKTVEDAFKSKGDYDFTPALAVLTLPLWAPIAALGFAILLPSVPLHFTEASVRFASQEVISRLDRLKKSKFLASFVALMKHNVAVGRKKYSIFNNKS